MTPRDEEPRVDAHLKAALRHAPDAQVVPPPALSEQILRQAREAVAPAASEPIRLGRQRSSGGKGSLGGVLSSVVDRCRAFWVGGARGPLAGAFAGTMVASVVAVMWWGRPPEEAFVPKPPPVAASLPESMPEPEAPHLPEASLRSSPEVAAAPAPEERRAEAPEMSRRRQFAEPQPAIVASAPPVPPLAPTEPLRRAARVESPAPEPGGARDRPAPARSEAVEPAAPLAADSPMNQTLRPSPSAVAAAPAIAEVPPKASLAPATAAAPSAATQPAGVSDSARKAAHPPIAENGADAFRALWASLQQRPDGWKWSPNGQEPRPVGPPFSNFMGRVGDTVGVRWVRRPPSPSDSAEIASWNLLGPQPHHFKLWPRHLDWTAPDGRSWRAEIDPEWSKAWGSELSALP